MALDREILSEILQDAIKNSRITKNAILAKLELNDPPLANYIANLCLRYNFDVNFVLAIIAHESALYTSEQLSTMKGIDKGFFQINYHPERVDNNGPVQEWLQSNREPLPDPLSAKGNAEIGMWYLSWVRDYVRALSDPPPRNTTEELAVIATAYHGLGHAVDYERSLGLKSLRAEYYWSRVMNYYARFSASGNDFAGIITGPTAQPTTIANLYDAINNKEVLETEEESDVEESEYAPVEFPVLGYVEDTGYLRINDIEFEHIPPSQISVTKESMHKQSAAMRSSSNTFLRTGQTRINIQVILDFVDQNAPGKPFITAHDYINQKLRPLLAQFLLTPFCHISNAHIATQIYNIAGIGTDKNVAQQSSLALALTDFVLTTHPQSPGGLRLALNFLYFNYQPFSSDFSYLRDFDEHHLRILNDPSALAEYKNKGMLNWFAPADSPLESRAFKKFYQNKLASLAEVNGPLSSYFTMSFDTEPLGSKDPFVPRLNSGNPSDVELELQEEAALRAQNKKNTIESIEIDTPNSILSVSGGLKITGISVTFSNHLSTIPLLSWEYPTIQFLGAKDINVSVDFQSIGRNGAHEQLSNLRRFHAIVDRKAISNKSTRRSSVSVVNDILGLVGITNAILNNIETHTTESPELVVGRLSLGVVRKIPPRHEYDPTFDFVTTNQNKHSFYKELLAKFIEASGVSFELNDREFSRVFDSSVTTRIIHKFGRFTLNAYRKLNEFLGFETANSKNIGTIEIKDGFPVGQRLGLILKLGEIFENNIKDFVLDFDPFNLAKSLLSPEDLKALKDEFLEAAFLGDTENLGPLSYVAEVIDGDTIKLDNGSIISIRFLSVNTPEIANQFKGTEDQPGAVEAKQFLEDLLLNKAVRIHSDGIDPFGRTLAYVYLPDGTSVSGLIAANGYAKGRRVFISEGVRALGRFLDTNYLEIYSILSDGLVRGEFLQPSALDSLRSIASQVGNLQNVSYPDFDFSGIVDGSSGQDINPDFYFYNRHEDPETNLASTKKITDEAIEIINTQHLKYSEFLYDQALRGREQLISDESSVDISQLNISNKPLIPATNSPATEADKEEAKNYKPQTPIEHRFDHLALSELLATSISSTKLNQYKLRRAYPTFQIYFLEEDDVQFGWRSYNDFYTSDTVEFIMVTRSREIPADTAYIRLNNFTGELTKKKFKKVNPETLREDIKTQSAPLVDTISENPAEDLIFREGTRVQVRLGYENNPNKLPVVFNGIITSMSGTDTIEIYCQSFAIELTNTIVSPLADGLIELAPGVDLMNFNSNYNTRLLAQRLLRKPEVIHFGRWAAENGIDLWAPLKANFPGVNYTTEIRPDGKHVPRWHFYDTPVDDNVFIPDFGKGNDFDFFASKSNPILKGDQAFLTLFFMLDQASFRLLEKVGLADGLFTTYYNFLYKYDTRLWTSPFYAQPTSSVWDIMQELTLRYPGYICSVVPFDDRMTIFFGHPSQQYCWREKTLSEELAQVDRGKAFDWLTNPLSHKNFAYPKDSAPFGYFKSSIREEWKSESIKKEDIDFIEDELKNFPVIDTTWYSDRQDTVLVYPGSTESIITGKINSVFTSNIIKPFRNYHLVTSYHDIVSNEIRADFNGTITVAHIGWSGAPKDKPRNTSTIKLDDGIPDPDSFEAEAFPGAYRDAMFNEINVHNYEEALRYGVSYLCKSLKDLYKGDLIIIGNPEMKPYDRVFIYDDYNDMAGPVDIKQVVHTFSPEYGFTTTITPDCVIEPGDSFNFTTMKALGHAWTSFYKETNEALTQVGWTPSLSGVIAGLGFINGVMKVRGRDPIIITPLVRNGAPWVNGIAGYQRGNYWLEWGGSINRYFTAFKDGVNYFKDNMYEGLQNQAELVRRTKIDWKF